MILNESSVEIDDQDKALLCKGQSFAPTSIRNTECLMAHRHVRRTDQSWPSALFALFSY